ncbi:MAG: VIT domain-containing protein [Myxococcota bacterium]
MRFLRISVLVLVASLLALPSFAAGTLAPTGSADPPLQILNHHLDVVINNGFARTEVTQTFFNPADRDLEAIYSFPIPESASLSEVTIFAGEEKLEGEVVARAEAERVYVEERDAGRDAGIASKNGIQDFQFRIARVPAGTQTRMRFVYYQPLKIDTGVGRFVYPLESGGTDDLEASFWTRNETVGNLFSASFELKSAWPIDEVRMPGLENAAQIERLGEGHLKARVEAQGAALSKDLVFYYRLAENLPGRVEVLTHRASEQQPGTFMAIVTPGLDLKPLRSGADYVFVLDVSGSMSGGKIETLTRGIQKVVGDLSPNDRFRIITFNDKAKDITRGFVTATPEGVSKALAQVSKIDANGGTNLYAGIERALDDLDADRATSVILVTDAVTNQGIVDPRDFHQMLAQYDVRLFGFLLGNSGNWPLMRTIAEATGGFHTQISNADDILGQILLAKSKVTHEALHGASLAVRGVDTSGETGEVIGKVYRGEQLVLFGRYHEAGKAKLRLEANLTGQDKTYETTLEFPEVDLQHPELERLWAMSMIEELEDRANAGRLEADEKREAIRGLGVDYQLVTDETSMIVLADAAFDRRGIDRANRDRVAKERAAQQARANAPIVNPRVDRSDPMFGGSPAPRLGGGGGSGGGGAIDPLLGVILVALGSLAACWPLIRPPSARRAREDEA